MVAHGAARGGVAGAPPSLAASQAQLNDASLPPWVRINDLERLDSEAVHASAITYGLHAAFRDVLAAQGDVGELTDLYASGICCAYVQFVACEVFRGQRRSTNAAGGSSFNKMDGARVAAFIESADDAWDVFVGAVAALAAAATSSRVARAAPEVHANAHRSARDVVNAMVATLARREVAEALFEPREGSDEEKAFLKALAPRRTSSVGAFSNAPAETSVAAPK